VEANRPSKMARSDADDQIKRPRFTPGALFCVWDCGIVWVLLRRGKQTRSVPWWISWDSDPALEGRR